MAVSEGFWRLLGPYLVVLVGSWRLLVALGAVLGRSLELLVGSWRLGGRIRRRSWRSRAAWVALVWQLITGPRGRGDVSILPPPLAVFQ